MKARGTLPGLLEASAARYPERLALDVPDGATISYRDLDRLTDRVRDRLQHWGIQPGDRVGICLPKSIDAVAAIFGSLKAGAAYVPVDAEAPAERRAYILDDCSVRVVVCTGAAAESLRPHLDGPGGPPLFLLLDESESGIPLAAALDREQQREPAGSGATVDATMDDLAYILYTSGSTGRPKGVMLTHRNALSFVDWCSDEFAPTADEVFSSHAPLHFDLSIFDLFVAVKHGATLVLIGDRLGKDPLSLAPVIARKRISVWYSTPSILSMLAAHGKLARYDFSALRLVLFAGEVFPIPRLRALRACWPEPRFYNLYGPTETNVCTYAEIPAEIPEERTEPFPIGRVCEPNRVRVVDPDGGSVPPGEEGELLVNGPNVMAGYWNLPAQNARVFVTDSTGERWYRTGDIVVEREGSFTYRGRRDRMVKRHGYRIELGEIEAGLARHPSVREVAVTAVGSDGAGTRIQAHLSIQGETRPSIIELKEFSSQQLPRYMVPDTFTFVEALPRTSTGKIDYQSLAAVDGAAGKIVQPL
jgi:amino acid adenylation domain-containing protein